MTYATEQDLIDRYGETELGQLTDRVNGQAIDSVIVGRALADADAEIDGYIAGRVALPLDPVPAVLPRLAADMARYYLHGASVTDEVRRRYEDAVRVLKAIADGSVTLGGPAPVAAASTGIAVAARAPAATFGSDGLAGY